MRRRNQAPPVGEPQFEQVADALRRINDAWPIIQKLELCGTDCTQWRELFKSQEEQLNKIRAHFFDGR